MPEDQLMSDKEFDELDRFLMSEQCSDEAMTMDALHGYLTAIAIGPEPVPTDVENDVHIGCGSGAGTSSGAGSAGSATSRSGEGVLSDMQKNLHSSSPRPRG